MAIGANANIDFFGTPDALGTTPATVINTAVSLTSDLSEWTNDDDAPEVNVTIKFETDTTGAANTTITLLKQQLEVDGANDEEPPDVTNFLQTYAGTFHHNNPSVALQYKTIRVKLDNSKTSAVWNFYIVNNTGETIALTWDLTITPVANGPHA